MEHRQITKFRQIKIYTEKCFRIFANEKGWKIFISSAIIMLLISMVTGSDMFDAYKATRNGAFAIVCACIWIGIFNSIQSVCKERDIIKREYRAGLSIFSYIASHMIFEAALCAVEALIVTLIVIATNITNIPLMGVLLPSYIELYITIYLAIFSADILGLMVSSIVKTPNSAMTVMPFVLILQLVMSGVIFELEGIALMISNFTVCKWSLNAICSIADINNMSDAIIYATYAYPEDYDHTLQTLAKCWGILIAFIAVYGAVSVISLKSVEKDKR